MNGVQIAAVLLAGGRATRMDGLDKGLIDLHGQPLIAHVLAVVRPQVDQVLVSANRNREQYAALGVGTVADQVADFPGPLAGMAAAMQVLDSELLFVCPCDSPFIGADIVARLHRALLAAGADIAVAHDGERPQPVFALLRRSLLADLQRFIAAGGRKIMLWYSQQKLAEVDFSDSPDTFININTPAECDAAEHRLATSGQAHPGESCPTIEKQPSCADGNETGLLPVAVAFERIATLVRPVTGRSTVAIRDALDRVLAEDIISPINVPSYTNSAMDGYAMASGDIPASGTAELRVIGTAWAGKPCPQPLQSGQCVRIMTGAMMPEGADTVVIQEHVGVRENTIVIDSDVRVGRNVRQAGEDVVAGSAILTGGTQIGPAQLGLLASLGIDRVAVLRRPTVAYFTTGDELRSLEQYAGRQLHPGELFDSNRYTLYGMLTRLGVEVIDLGVVPDDREATRRAMLEASAKADMVLTSGGVSAGAADFVTETLRELGDVAFWKLAMRPGRPLASGRVGDALFFGLPGNPVAVMVTFYELVQPAIRQLMGCSERLPPTVRVPCTTHLKKSPGRVEYQRGIYTNEQGVMAVRPTGGQGAGRLSSMSVANCLIILPAELHRVVPGTLVEVQLFAGLV